jgi:ABC-type uncharacterized transport system permease subunit
MKKKLFKYAFLQKNIRDLSFEKKVLLGTQILTMISCFAPWFSATRIYGEALFFNAFEGNSFLIGWLIFLMALGVTVFFFDRLLEKERIRLPFSENFLYFFAHGQQLLLVVLAWSVLASVGSSFEFYEIRFGLFLCLILQVVGLVSAYLNYQIGLQNKAENFFSHPPQS